MQRNRFRPTFPVLSLILLAAFGCDAPGAHAAENLPEPAVDLAAAKPGEMRTAVLAGGCFWCVEAIYEQLDGVKDATSGFAGDTKETATYEKVSSGETKHAEAIRITYDPSKITYAQLLRVFFTIFDPTTLDAQGPDHGHQYRTAIFYANDDEKRVAEAYIKQLTDAKAFDQPIVTTVEPIGDGFFPAEEYHQNFAALNADHPYIRTCSWPEQKRLREKFKSLVKPTTRKSD